MQKAIFASKFYNLSTLCAIVKIFTFGKNLFISLLLLRKGKDIKIKMDYRIRMRNLREDNDLTQQEIAVVLETSRTMYASYERGANDPG